MEQYNIHTAKTHLSRLVDGAARGEEFIIAKAGKPMVKVIPINPIKLDQKRVGFLSGKIEVPYDFDEMGQGIIIKAFEG